MRDRLKRSFYHVCKALGLFWLARHLTGGRLRILCYHGFSFGDEHLFRPGLFMQPAVFKGRMAYLKGHGFPVLPLEEALSRLADGSLPPCATAITIDDGFHSVHALAKETLNAQGFPAMLYLTTYYSEKGTPIYRLAVSYMIWKSVAKAADLSSLGIAALADGPTDLSNPEARQRAEETIRDYGETACDEPERVALTRKLAACLDIDYGSIEESRMLSLINPQEAMALEASGITIELHTHRHTFPADPPIAHKELDDNSNAIERLIGRRPTHFCYPSGEWSSEHWPILKASGVATATTCESGLIDSNVPRFALHRILDDSRVSQVEFEAEVYGFSELIRSCKRALRGGRAA